MNQGGGLMVTLGIAGLLACAGRGMERQGVAPSCCPSCGMSLESRIRRSAKFCPYCGEKLPRGGYCGECNATWEVGKYCPIHGVELREAKVEKEEGKAIALLGQILTVIKGHPDGISLVDISKELGVDWHGLTSAAKMLVERRRVKKENKRYCSPR